MAMGYGNADLAAALTSSPQSDYVRVVAHWLAHGEIDDSEPQPTGNALVDALVASAVAHLARLGNAPIPSWTHDSQRCLDALWHLGSDRFFAYALAHTPAEFLVRGVIVERDSLVSV